jgi:hypothetical protein
MTRRNRNAWAISLFYVAEYVLLAGASMAAYAAELFPYNPPAATSARQVEQRSLSRTAELSADQLRRIEQLARDVRSLPPAQNAKASAEVRREHDQAVARGDLSLIRYYNELSRRIDNAR